MRRARLFSMLTLLAVVVASCNFGSTPAPATEPPATQPPATDAPAEATEAPATPALVTVDLAGPPMKVGSKYTYVDGSILVAVPGGPFIMGYSYADNPKREVTVSDFWIYSSEVTNQQYALCVAAGQCTPPAKDKNPDFGNYRFINLPVVGVDYDQAASYCKFVNGRLPTEAEWEKAARGPDGNLFPWGNSAPSCSLLNYNFCKGKTIDIQSYPDGVSYYGAFDMSGNVREWVADWYSAKYHQLGEVQDPLGPQLGEKRTIRSSSFADSADSAISAHRFSLKPIEALPDLGFRCVVQDPTFFAPNCTTLTYTGYGPDGSQSDCVPSVKCNTVDVSLGLNCKTYNDPYTIVTFSVSNTPPDSWSFDAPGCTPLGGNKFECKPGQGPAIATGSCVDLNSCAPGCPMHYVKQGDVCVWDGSGTSGTACIPGQTYDPVNQCCSATPGSGVDFNICPAGTYPLNGACVPNPGAVVDSVNKAVIFDACTPPGQGDDDTNSCQPPANGCGFKETWDPSICKCRCIGTYC